jgi:hypothetical protein
MLPAVTSELRLRTHLQSEVFWSGVFLSDLPRLDETWSDEKPCRLHMLGSQISLLGYCGFWALQNSYNSYIAMFESRILTQLQLQVLSQCCFYFFADEFIPEKFETSYDRVPGSLKLIHWITELDAEQLLVVQKVLLTQCFLFRVRVTGERVPGWLTLRCLPLLATLTVLP